jgi:hypothetical protein
MADFPDGFAIRYRGQTYMPIGIRNHEKQNGEIIRVVDWKTNCPECGAEFIAFTPISGSCFTRRCQACRRIHKGRVRPSTFTTIGHAASSVVQRLAYAREEKPSQPADHAQITPQPPRATAHDTGASSPLGPAGDTGGASQPVAKPARSTTDADGWVDRFLDE